MAEKQAFESKKVKCEPPPGRETWRGLCCESWTRSIECVEDSVRKESREDEWEGRNRSGIVRSSNDERTLISGKTIRRRCHDRRLGGALSPEMNFKACAGRKP